MARATKHLNGFYPIACFCFIFFTLNIPSQVSILIIKAPSRIYDHVLPSYPVLTVKTQEENFILDSMLLYACHVFVAIFTSSTWILFVCPTLMFIITCKSNMEVVAILSPATTSSLIPFTWLWMPHFAQDICAYFCWM